MSYAIGAAIAAVLFGVTWLVQRLFREPNGDGWKERSAHETGRADGAEEALDRFETVAAARQEALEKELNDYAASVAAEPDPRRRVQAGWAERAREASGEIDRADTVPDGKADPAAN